MGNPWMKLPDNAPFVLPNDAPEIHNFNQKQIKRLTKQGKPPDPDKNNSLIDLKLLPEPFLGNPQAPVVLLNLNPGWDSTDACWHEKEDFKQKNRDNLEHKNVPYPFYLLHPNLSQSPGGLWWRRHLRELINKVGLKAVATGVLVVELFPYHSGRFGFKGAVPSQQYSVSLVEQAIRRGAMIVVLRAEKQWVNAVPQLAGKYHRVKSVQSAYISSNNCPGFFQEIVSRL